MACPKRHLFNWSSFRAITSAHVIRALLPRLSLILAVPILLGGFLQACGGGGGGAPVTSLKSLTIDPVNSSIAVGTKVQLHATGTYTNKKTKDLTESVTWISADSTVANVSNLAGTKGLSTGAAVGATTVAIKFQGKTGTSIFTVTHATLTSITVQPVNPTVSKGTTVQMAALGNFSDGSVQDLTTQVSWSSGNTSIATVSNTVGTLGLVTGVSVGNTPITATLSGIAGSTAVTVTAATLTSITITIPADSIAKGTTLQLFATCNFSDGTTEDCTDEVSWTSSNSGIAQVSDTPPTKGLVTGAGVGNSTISGSFGGMQGSATVTVTTATLISITVLPDPSIAKGSSIQLTATGTFSDETTQDLTTQVSWTSGNNAIAQVSNVPGTQGFVTGLAIGSTLITAALNGIEGSTMVTVTAATLISITITPPDPSIADGTTVQLTAAGNFSDGTIEDLTSQVSWTSGNNAIAQVSNVPISKGLVFGIGLGNTSITATAPPTLGTMSGSTTVTVTAATLTSIVITPPDPSIARGTTVQRTATGTFSDGTTEDLTGQVSWTSANNAIAEVSNIATSKGRVFGVGAGSTSIIATLNGIQGSGPVTVTPVTLTSIAITPPNPSIAKGTTVQLTATGIFSDNTTQDLTHQVSWSSTAEKVALVGNGKLLGGLVFGLKTGKATISAVLNRIKGETTITITDATLKAIVVVPPFPSIAKGTNLQLKAIGVFSDLKTEDLTDQVSWTSGNKTIAQVSNVPGTQGLVSGLGIGSTSIAANLDGVSGSTKVTVTAATLVSLSVTPVNPSIAKGTTVQMIAIGTFTDGTTEDLTNQVSWTSVNPTFATVDPTGLVFGEGVGTAEILATLRGVPANSTTVTVTPATLVSLSVTPVNPSIAKGTAVQMTATGIFSDGTTQDLTAQVSWLSMNTSVATVDPTGLVTGVTEGIAEILATRTSGPANSTTVTVTAATLKSIAVTPVNPSIAKGTTVQMAATGTFTDGTTQDLTNQVSWSSLDTGVAIVNLTGLVFGEGVGSAEISATLTGVPANSTTVTVTTATLVSLSVTPVNPSIAKGTTVQMTATGTFTDGTTQDLTDQVHWTSGDQTIAVVDPTGLVHGTAVGSAAILATPTSGPANSTTVTVTNATVTQLIIAIAPASPPFPPQPPTFTLKEKTEVKLVAIAMLSDDTFQDVTSNTSWTSNNPSVADVLSTGSDVTSGKLTAKKQGTATITATFRSALPGSSTLQGTAIVNVTS